MYFTSHDLLNKQIGALAKFFRLMRNFRDMDIKVRQFNQGSGIHIQNIEDRPGLRSHLS